MSGQDPARTTISDRTLCTIPITGPWRTLVPPAYLAFCSDCLDLCIPQALRTTQRSSSSKSLQSLQKTFCFQNRLGGSIVRQVMNSIQQIVNHKRLGKSDKQQLEVKLHKAHTPIQILSWKN